MAEGGEFIKRIGRGLDFGPGLGFGFGFGTACRFGIGRAFGRRFGFGLAFGRGFGFGFGFGSGPGFGRGFGFDCHFAFGPRRRPRQNHARPRHGNAHRRGARGPCSPVRDDAPRRRAAVSHRRHDRERDASGKRQGRCGNCPLRAGPDARRARAADLFRSAAVRAARDVVCWLPRSCARVRADAIGGIARRPRRAGRQPPRSLQPAPRLFARSWSNPDYALQSAVR